MEKLENDEDEKTISPSDKHYSDFEGAAVPAAPDGGIQPGYALEQPIPPPAVTPENFVCLRGPCRHYWHMITMAGEGNPEGTWAALGLSKPRQHNHTCLVNPGMETNLNDDCVYECSQWDPYSPAELMTLRSRRKAYFDRNPEIEEASDGTDDSDDAA